jgi:hypothetical protein
MRRLFLLITLVGCSSSPVDVTGDYSVQITNGANGCNFSNYNVGDTAMDIPVTITQNGDTATATVTGVTGDYLNLVLGANAFAGSVDGSSLDLTLDGTRSTTSGNCTFTYNASISADLNADSLSGNINYTPDPNTNSDCASIEGCVTTQALAGSRPPK